MKLANLYRSLSLERELRCGAASGLCGDAAWTGASGGWVLRMAMVGRSGLGEGVDDRPGHAPSAVRVLGARAVGEHAARRDARLGGELATRVHFRVLNY